MSLRVERVEVYGDRERPAMVVGVVRDARSLEGGDMVALARAEALARLVFTLPPRLDGCALRARTFTASRELPRCVESALAVAALEGRELTLEEGVTSTRVRRIDDARWEVEAPAAVAGSLDLDDPAALCAALGIVRADLDPRRAPRAASCGLNVLVAALCSDAALRAARLDPPAWRALLGKARHHGVMLVHEGGEAVRARMLTLDPDPCDVRGDGLAACAAMRYLDLGTPAPPDARRFVFEGDDGWRATLTVRGGPTLRVVGSARA